MNNVLCHVILNNLSLIVADVLRIKACGADDRPIFLVGDDGDVQVQADPEAPLPLGTIAEVPNGVNNVVHQNGNQSNFPSSAFLLTPPSVSQTSSSLCSATPNSCLASGKLFLSL